MVAVPSTGRAFGVEAPSAPPGADETRDLYERYAGRIFSFCLHQLGSREEAEDAVQTTFLNAFRGLRRGVVPELETAWLYKIATNVCHSRRRSSVRRLRVETPGDIDALQDVLPAPSRYGDELHRLRDALAGMPEQQRQAILLREWQGLSYREIAAELGVSQSAVETLIFRARRSLAQGLEQPEKRSRRLRKGANVGSLLATLKSALLGGSAAVKAAAVIAAVATATVAAEKKPLVPSRHPSKPRLQHVTRPTTPTPASADVSTTGQRPVGVSEPRRVPKVAETETHSSRRGMHPSDDAAAPVANEPPPAPASAPPSAPASPAPAATPPPDAPVPTQTPAKPSSTPTQPPTGVTPEPPAQPKDPTPTSVPQPPVGAPPVDRGRNALPQPPAPPAPPDKGPKVDPPAGVPVPEHGPPAAPPVPPRKR